jgi:hypothetical protein
MCCNFEIPNILENKVVTRFNVALTEFSRNVDIGSLYFVNLMVHRQIYSVNKPKTQVTHNLYGSNSVVLITK